MALDEATKMALQKLQGDALDILQEITDLFPKDRYCFTLIARHVDNIENHDIILTDDVMDDAIGALERNKAKMESAS